MSALPITETVPQARSRHYFDKFGGNMGATGCVDFLFTLKGVIVLDNEDGDIDEDKAMEDILEAGGDDFGFEDGVVEITTDPSAVATVAEELGKKGYKVVSAEAEQVPPHTRPLPTRITSRRWVCCWKPLRTTTMFKMYGTTGTLPSLTTRIDPRFAADLMLRRFDRILLT